MEQHLQAIATILSLVNPFVCGAMFARIESGRDLKQQLRCATKASIAISGHPVDRGRSRFQSTRDIRHFFGRVLGRGRDCPGLDGFFHAPQQTDTGGPRSGRGRESLTRSVDHVRRQSRDHHGRDHAIGGAHEARSSGDRARRYRGRGGRDLDCHGAGWTGRRATNAKPRAGYRVALHGPDHLLRRLNGSQRDAVAQAIDSLIDDYQDADTLGKLIRNMPMISTNALSMRQRIHVLQRIRGVSTRDEVRASALFSLGRFSLNGALGGTLKSRQERARKYFVRLAKEHPQSPFVSRPSDPSSRSPGCRSG